MTKILTVNEVISPTTQACITFHIIRWGNEMDSLTLRTGGSILFHRISADTLMHSHEFHEICLILKGRIRHRTPQRNDVLEGPVILFIRSQDEHYFEQYHQESCELVNFAFSQELYNDMVAFVGNDQLQHNFISPSSPPAYKIPRSVAEDLSVQLLTINSLEITNPEVAAIRVRKILLNLFVSFFVERHTEAVSRPEIPTWLTRVCNMMKQDENLRGGLKQMQKLAGRTPEHLCACFRKYLNKTPTEFINELRVFKAARRLLETDEKILAIAYDLGFRSQSRFYSVFKKYYNISPARYRELSQRNDIPLRPG